MHTTRQMTSSCFVVEGKPFLVDCGDGFGTIRQMIRVGVDPALVRDIIITHRHADHIIGIAHLLFYIFVKHPQARVSLYGPKQALSAVKTISLLTHDLTKKHKHQIAFVPLSTRKEFKVDKNFIVTATRVSGAEKSSTECFAYAIKIGKKKIVFSSDMKPNNNFKHVCKGADILIHECFGTVENEDWIHSSGHSTAKDAALLASVAGIKQLFLTHIFPKKGIEEKIFKEAKIYFQGPIFIACDCMEVQI